MEMWVKSFAHISLFQPIFNESEIYMKLIYIPKIGKLAGLPHVPYQNKDGLYVVSKDRFQDNYVYVKTVEEAYSYLEKGLKIRMQYDKKAPSLIKLSSLEIVR